MIVVSGAGGKTGLAVIGALAKRGHAVRALAKDEEKGARVRQAGAGEVVRGDMREEAVWRQALDGAQALYHIGPNMHPDEMAMGLLAVAQAAQAGVGRFVYHSVLHPQTEAMPHHWHKLRVEEALLTSGLPFTILQPAAYMQNMQGSRRAILEEGILQAPYPVATRLSLVHLQDVAEAAAQVLTEAGHAGATYELVGTEPLSQSAVARALGEALGRPLQARELPLAQWRRNAEASGLDPYAIEGLSQMFRYYAAYGFAGNSRVLAWLLGRPPHTIADFAREMGEGEA